MADQSQLQTSESAQHRSQSLSAKLGRATFALFMLASVLVVLSAVLLLIFTAFDYSLGV